MRTARRDDLAALVEIYNQAVRTGCQTAHTTPFTVEDRLQWFEDHPPEKYPIIITETEDGILGYLSLSAYRPGRMALRHTAEVSTYVDSAHHRQGVGSVLLRYALDMCPSLDIKTLVAILLGNNRASIALLKKFGFQQWGWIPRAADFDGEEVDHVYYGKRILLGDSDQETTCKDNDC